MTSGHGVTVFLDDDPGLIQLFRQRLEARGFSRCAACVTSIEEADALLASGGITRLVTDWKMPGRDGISYLQATRQKYPKLVLSLLTGFADNLQDGDRMVLRRIDAEIFDKGEIFRRGTDWLVSVVVSGVEDGSVSQQGFSQPPGADTIVRLKLENEGLHEMTEQLLRARAAELAAELDKIEDKESPSIIGPSGRRLTIAQVIREIRDLSELGRKLIRLDSQVRARASK